LIATYASGVNSFEFEALTRQKPIN